MAEVHRPNMLAWLAGKPQVLSEQNQLKVCEILGWRYGKLRRDIVHRWDVTDDLSACIDVLKSFELPKPENSMIVYRAQRENAPPATIIFADVLTSAPLVILISRKLGYSTPLDITSTSLGMGTDGPTVVSISENEWHEYWQVSTTCYSSARYMEVYGTNIRNAVQRRDKEMRRKRYDPITTVFEETEWEDILNRAMDAGMSFEEIAARVRQVLGVQ